VSPETWARIEGLFHDLADLPAAEQEARLEAIADPEIAGEVRALLGAGSAQSMVVSAVAAVAGSATAPGAVPQRFGPWRVTGIVGHGGMGAVYQGVRDDQAFVKQVAIKVLHLGFDSLPARDRFRQERSILAGLEHPNIARLLDGGETDTGVSYIVMEYVDGEPIVDYCVRRKLGRQARLRLFLQVCSAVHLAHQKLVVHRDLKPGNILVTRDGVPKLLDFGIAKLMEPSAMQTMTGFLALTPQYASPEQIRGEPVTTASDVYSLGMVLYEMLAERRPYEVSTTALTRIARDVCETQPAPPDLDPDLDNILLMALRKEPGRRYASVQEFADDVERALTHRPVRARPASLPYRAGKFVRRNAVTVAAAVLVVGSLSGGLAMSLRAQRRERARFDQVRQLATRFLFEFDVDIRQLPGSIPARERLVRTALQTLDSLSRDAAGDPELAAELAQAYISVGEVQGLPGLQSLGHTAEAEASFRKAVELLRPAIAPGRATDLRRLRLAAFAHNRMGYLLWRTSRSAEARQWILDGLAILEPAIAAGKGGAQEFRTAANAHTYLSQIDQQELHGKRAAEHAAKGVELMRKYQAVTEGVRARSDLARAIVTLASAAASTGDLARSEALLGESLAMREAIYREKPLDVENRREWAVALHQLAGLQFLPAARIVAAEREQVRLMREIAEAGPKNDNARHDLGLALRDLADALAETDPHGAEAAAREAIRILAARPAGSPSRDRHVGLLHAVLSGLLRSQKRTAEARAAMAEAERGFARENPKDGLARGDFLTLWYVRGEYGKVWERLSPSLPGASEDIYLAYELADCALRLGRRQQASEIWAPWKGRIAEADRKLGL
jgi:hypothetical protein